MAQFLWKRVGNSKGEDVYLRLIIISTQNGPMVIEKKRVLNLFINKIVSILSQKLQSWNLLWICLLGLTCFNESRCDIQHNSPHAKRGQIHLILLLDHRKTNLEEPCGNHRALEELSGSEQREKTWLLNWSTAWWQTFCCCLVGILLWVTGRKQ